MERHCFIESCHSPANATGSKKRGSLILAHLAHIALSSLQNQVINEIKNNSETAARKRLLKNLLSCCGNLL